MISNKLKITIAIVVVVILILLVVLYRTHKTRHSKKQDECHADEAKIALSPQKKSDLQPPNDIQLTVEGSSIKVKWTDVPMTDTYTVYYSNTPDFKKEEARTINGVDKGEFEINKVPRGKYYFRVSSSRLDKRTSGPLGAIDPRKVLTESELSELHSVEITECTPIEAPKDVHSNVIQADKNTFKVLISWRPEVSSDGYVIHLNHTEPPKNDQTDYMIVKVSNVDANSHLLEGLEASLKWYATVSCNGSHCGPGTPSNVLTLN